MQASTTSQAWEATVDLPHTRAPASLHHSPHSYSFNSSTVCCCNRANLALSRKWEGPLLWDCLSSLLDQMRFSMAGEVLLCAQFCASASLLNLPAKRQTDDGLVHSLNHNLGECQVVGSSQIGHNFSGRYLQVW